MGESGRGQVFYSLCSFFIREQNMAGLLLFYWQEKRTLAFSVPKWHKVQLENTKREKIQLCTDKKDESPALLFLIGFKDWSSSR